MGFPLEEEYMTKQEVCEHFGIGSSTLERWMNRKLFPFPKPTCKKGPYRNSPNLWPKVQVVQWAREMPQRFPYGKIAGLGASSAHVPKLNKPRMKSEAPPAASRSAELGTLAQGSKADTIAERRPQQVRWGPTVGQTAGILTWNAADCTNEKFIARPELKKELQVKLTPQLFADKSSFRFELLDHHGKADWLVQIFDIEGKYCDVWFGVNPEKGWSFDGLVHFGQADVMPHIWQSYQRYSDGSYMRLPSLVRSLDEKNSPIRGDMLSARD
jgi:hypothetical protein